MENDVPDTHTGQLNQPNLGVQVTGNVNTEGGDFVGRDKSICGDEVYGDKVMGDKHVHHHHYTEPRKVDMVQPPVMALAPPKDYVQRSAEFSQLIYYLLNRDEKTVAITATIRGAGGFGKTTLAQAICHDQRIRGTFPGGILWATVGDDKANVLLGLRKFYHALTGKEAKFVDQDDATTQLSSVLVGRRCLIVTDDVWNAAHLQPFLEGGERCARLVTTRIASVIPREAEVVTLDAMQVSEATALLGAGLAYTDATALSQLASRLGEWPLLLKLVNRRVYEDVKQYGLSLVDAITSVNEELDEFGLTAFDVDDTAERSQAVAASIDVSLRRLKSDVQYARTQVDEAARFLELAIFPEDTPIPLRTLALLWQQTGQLSFGATERLCRRLADLALILRYNIQAATILLHDVTRHYLLNRAATDERARWHSALLDGYRAQCQGKWWQLSNDGYLYQLLLWHLQEAQQQDAIETLLFTYHWLDAKLQATDIVSLIHDFDFRHDKQPHSPLSLLRHTLQMSINVLTHDKDQLVSQLYGRLYGLGEPWTSFVAEIAKQKRVSWLQPQSPDLMRPGGSLLYTLRGHTAGVSNLLLTPAGHLISSCGSESGDSSVKVWDIEQGVLLHTLEGRTAGVSNLLLTPTGHLISSYTGSRNSIINKGESFSVKVWDIEQGILLHTLEGHTDDGSNLLLTPTGRLISSCNHRYNNIIDNSRDFSVKVWDIEQGTLLHTLEGHTAGVSNLLLTPTGHLISSCSSLTQGGDSNVKVWDIKQTVLLHTLKGHTDGVSNLLLMPTGRLISSCSRIIRGGDFSVKVWDIEQGVQLHTLEGHTAGVSNLLLTPTGHLISSCNGSRNNIIDNSRDFSVKVWDIEQGTLLHTLEGHTAGVSNLLLTPTGHLISSCSIDKGRDFSVKVWDIEQGILLYSLNEYIASIQGMILSRMPDCFVTTGGNQLTIWNWHEGKKFAQFTTDSAIYTFTQAGNGMMIVGDGLGQVHFLQLVRS